MVKKNHEFSKHISNDSAFAMICVLVSTVLTFLKTKKIIKAPWTVVLAPIWVPVFAVFLIFDALMLMIKKGR